MPILIRGMQMDDRAQWLAAWRDFRSGETDKPLPEELIETTWRRFLTPDVPLHAAGAFEDGQMLGFVHYLFHYSVSSIGPLCYLQTLYTAPGARGKGIGRSLIETVCTAAKEAGSPRVYWQMHADNAAARILYEKVAERTDFVQYRKNF